MECEILRLVTTSNDYAFTVLHTSQITIGHARSSQSVTVFTSRCLVASSNGGRSPSSGLPNCPRPQLPASHSNSSERLNPSAYLTNSLTHQPTDCLQTLSRLIFSKSKWKSFGQPDLVSSPILGPRPDFCYCQTVVLLITSRHGRRRKHCSSAAVQFLPWNCFSCLLAESLLRNGCCTVAYFAVVA
jgi:hypothetical protein